MDSSNSPTSQIKSDNVNETPNDDPPMNILKETSPNASLINKSTSSTSSKTELIGYITAVSPVKIAASKNRYIDTEVNVGEESC